MKRFLMICLLVLLGSTLIACDTFTDKDIVNEAPEVTGDSYLTFNKGDDEPDWKDYVDATDLEDGAIRITDDMIDLNDLDMNTAGIYEIDIYVPDSNGTVSLFVITVEVIDNGETTENILERYYEELTSTTATFRDVSSNYSLPAEVQKVELAEDGGEDFAVIFTAHFTGYSSSPGTYLVAIDLNTNEIRGLRILETFDTPNIGALIAEEEFYNQFNDMSLEDADIGNYDEQAGASYSITLSGFKTSLTNILAFYKAEFLGDVPETDAEKLERYYDEITSETAIFTDVTGDYTLPTKILKIELANNGTADFAVVYTVAFQGYNSMNNSYLISFDLNTSNIIGVRVIQSSDTPGIGNQIADETFFPQFDNITIEAAQAGGFIDDVTGASFPITLSGFKSSLSEVVDFYTAEFIGDQPETPEEKLARYYDEITSDTATFTDVTGDYTLPSAVIKVELANDGAKDFAVVYTVSFKGYTSIDTKYIIAIDLDTSLVLGVRVFEVGDTPGIGALIGEEEFFTQFANMTLANAESGNYDEQAGASYPLTLSVFKTTLSHVLEFYTAEFLGEQPETDAERLERYYDEITSDTATFADVTGDYTLPSAVIKVELANDGTKDFAVVYTVVFKGYTSNDTKYVVSIDLENNLVIGLRVFEAGDTRGMGALIGEEEFFTQFANMTLANVEAGNFDEQAGASYPITINDFATSFITVSTLYNNTLGAPPRPDSVNASVAFLQQAMPTGVTFTSVYESLPYEDGIGNVYEAYDAIGNLLGHVYVGTSIGMGGNMYFVWGVFTDGITDQFSVLVENETWESADTYVDPEKSTWGTDFKTTTWHDQYEGILLSGVLVPDTEIDTIAGVSVTTLGVITTTKTIALYHSEIIDLYYDFYDVEFIYNNESISTYTVLDTDVLAFPDLVVGENMSFDGWYIDEQYLFPYNPSNPLISDTTLYAREIDNTVFDNVSSNQIDITFWHIYGQSKSALLDEMIADFKLLYPNININSMSQGTYSDLKENVLSAFENNMLPNIVLGYDLDMQLYYQLGILNELSPFMNHTLFPLNINSFIDGYVSYNDNKLTSLPFSKSSEVLLYNKSLLSAHGIVFEENQVLTYAELQAIATTVVGTGENQCSALIGYDSISSYLSKEIYSSSIDFTNGIGESELVPVLTKLSTDYSSKIFTTPKVNDEYYGSTAFLNKEICMISAHSAGLRYNIPTYLSVEDTFEIGILPLPQMDNQTNTTVYTGSNIGLIQNDSMDEELASWMFIQYLLGAVNQAKFAAETLYSPVIKDAYDSDLLMNRGVDYKYEDMMFKVLKSQMNNDMKPNLFSNMNITILDDEVVQYLLGNIDASELYETAEVYNPFLTSGLYLKDEFDLLLDTESILLLDSIVLPDLYLGNSIVWSSSDEDILLPNGTVIRPLNGEGDKAVILTATITKDNVVLEKEFYYVVVENEPTALTINQFLFLENNEKATISGVVTGKVSGKGFHMSDDTGSIYVYLGSEPLVEIGDYIEILGYKKTYYNLDEIVDIESLEIISTGNLLPEFTPTSILDLYEIDTQNTNMYSTPILIQGIVEISGEFNNINISWFDENNTKQFVNVYYKSGSADKLAELETLVGTYVSVEAILQDYYSAGWWRINVNTNSVITELTLTDQEKAQYALSNIDLGDITNVTTNINLPLVGTYDFDIAWESSNALVIDEAGVVFASTVEQDVVLTAKITVNGVVYSRVFNIHVGIQ